MITNRQNRLDPSMVDHEDLDRLATALASSEDIALTDNAGKRTAIPRPLHEHLNRLIHFMQAGKAVVMIPEKERFTTQAAANYLGMSRQHLVNLMDAGEIPCIRVGKHRRIEFSDLIAYEKVRDLERRKALDRLSRKVDEAGLYDSDYTGGG